MDSPNTANAMDTSLKRSMMQAFHCSHRPPGHGSSEGLRGFVGDSLSIWKTLKPGQIAPSIRRNAALSTWPQWEAWLCVIMCPKSEGLAGIILSCPAMGFAVQIPGWKRASGEVMSKYIPHLSIPSGIQAHFLSYDTEVVAAYEKDPMISMQREPAGIPKQLRLNAGYSNPDRI